MTERSHCYKEPKKRGPSLTNRSPGRVKALKPDSLPFSISLGASGLRIGTSAREASGRVSSSALHESRGRTPLPEACG